MCLGLKISFSIYTVSSPKAALASALASSKALSISSSEFALRMPLPPPPAEALIKIGNPIFSAMLFAVSISVTAPSEPGTVGTLAFIISSRAADLFPICSMTLDDGPMNLIPFSSQSAANAGFSDRKPKPGWTASQPVPSAASIILSIFK